MDTAQQKALTRGELELARYLWPKLTAPTKIDLASAAQELNDVSAQSLSTQLSRIVQKGVICRVSLGVYRQGESSKVYLRIASRTKGYRLVEVDLEAPAPTEVTPQEISIIQAPETVPEAIEASQTEPKTAVDSKLEAAIVAIKLKIMHLQCRLKILQQAKEITEATLKDSDQTAE